MSIISNNTIIPKVYPLHKRHNNATWLLSYIIFFFILGSFIVFVPPQFRLPLLPAIPMWPIFLIFLFCTFFSLGTYLFKNKTHGVLIGAFLVVYLLLRLSHLTHPFFLILLIALFLTLELMISYRK